MFDMRSKVGILFQESALFDSMTIAENVAYPLLNQHAGHEHASSRRKWTERVKESLDFVELDQTLDKFPSELSGGMRRRVGIARAVVTDPPLLLYDSPTAGLDPITANTIIELIIKERDIRNTATSSSPTATRTGTWWPISATILTMAKIERRGEHTVEERGSSS